MFKSYHPLNKLSLLFWLVREAKLIAALTKNSKMN